MNTHFKPIRPQTGIDAVINGVYLGLNVVPSPYAVEARNEFHVEIHPIKKRRRGWRVVRHYIVKPAVFRIGDTLYVHPDLVERLRQATIL
jgi:hypothetical protein